MSLESLLESIETVLRDPQARFPDFVVQLEVRDLQEIAAILRAARDQGREQKRSQEEKFRNSGPYGFSSADFENIWRSAFEEGLSGTEGFEQYRRRQEEQRRAYENMRYENMRNSKFSWGSADEPRKEEPKKPPPRSNARKRPWFEVLGVPPDSTRDTIVRAYRKLALKNHPDRGGDHEKMSEINQAKDEALGGL